MATSHPRSPLARSLPNLMQVAGVRLSGVAAHIRYEGRKDLALFEFAPGTTAAGVFTKNACPGAPIPWCRQALANTTEARALLVNSGNANVFTGRAGDEAVVACATELADQLECPVEDIFLGSTGVIGEILPYQRILKALPEAIEALSEDGWEDALAAIMTTDTFPKAACREVSIGETTVKIQGIAKGSGMIAPDMATMLAYIATDAKLPQPVLQSLLQEGIGSSFNAITVDSDTSTSDMVMAFATGQAEHAEITEADDNALDDFRDAFHDLMKELAQLVIRDGEGATKLIQVEVQGAESNESARKVALSIANSPLVKTAIAGEDANWGRIVMAVGKSGEPADRDKLSIAVGDYWVARNGAIAEECDEEALSRYMREQEITLTADLGIGEGRSHVWTCDLTHGYIDINGSYRS
ncbi:MULTISPECIES: bifunctional glutamate N-acetyltransferase/amino-acid acetyltransferase ArgJ [unclassified Saccharibacter]|uniref:bifunctional glutamate N-acetyltransferase/amino-acid acetyltransferase ArgJ n=1 Tax=unclassified Saccharibacter TaxID=2648722 RepID=UPI00132827FE|nr:MULTISPECIES: bifunctional glutamate N-acetyltransferase/amino-acid acetyltransferase ArgJ [unclassified Saccharibacter]MXV35217.1 bifunctional glutamate N-acetyltransferase/amino-acid acetyltransferase ArgJ [Saccharibacter sp. EH611]MXV57236.1 bifunctional glutamate N-acetyltransferase/amino-acid acetyltransferase ArgJ [Saccharibacter sp. EH70]MXV64903.1 bifunctional glutamate N-acetyltransferase/amino-acid acetyltransferase ArgJ [Saccharibacter sp. EH60]